jgi:hypothetical protein
MNHLLVKLAGTGVVVMLAAGACTAKGAEPFKDAPQDGHHDNTPAKIIEMPDGFSNLAEKCSPHGHARIFSAYHGNDNRSALSVIQDESCPA